MTEITDDDEGKTVVTADGEKVGMVSGVEGNRAHVDPDPGITDQIKSTLGWEDVDEGDYALDDSHVAEITDDEVRLSR